MEEPIRIYSDLHLGHPGCRVESAEQLRPLLEGAGTVIINGDTGEMRHRALIKKSRKVMADLAALAAEIGVSLVHVRGNHDPDVSEIDHLDLAGGRVFVTHGDALFRLISPWSPKIQALRPQFEEMRTTFGEETLENDLEAVLACTHNCREFCPGYEDEFKTGWLKTFRTLVKVGWPPSRPAKILHTWFTSPAIAHAFVARHRPGAKVFTFGHTHYPGVWKNDGRIVVNTGGFLSFMPALGIELENGELIVRKIRKTGERFAMEGEVERVSVATNH